jgi:hypothetical protein
MIAKKSKRPKPSNSLASALARWESEGGAPGAASEPSRDKPVPLSADMSHRCGVSVLKSVGHQPDLFGESLHLEKLTRLYEQVDALQRKFGKHTVFLGSSFLAMKRDQHAGERGNLPERKLTLLPGETARKRLAIPYLGEVR